MCLKRVRGILGNDTSAFGIIQDNHGLIYIPHPTSITQLPGFAKTSGAVTNYATYQWQNGHVMLPRDHVILALPVLESSRSLQKL